MNTLGIEGDDSEKLSRIGSKILEHRRGDREFDCGREASLMFRLQHPRLALLPFLGQPIVVPLVLVCDGGQQDEREGMEVEPLQDVVDQI